MVDARCVLRTGGMMATCLLGMRGVGMMGSFRYVRATMDSDTRMRSRLRFAVTDMLMGGHTASRSALFHCVVAGVASVYTVEVERLAAPAICRFSI